MGIKLRVTSGSQAGKDIKIKGSQFLIGRAEDCQLRSNSEKISRHHCLITHEDGLLSIRDMGSKNGTYVNGEKIFGEQELNNHDHLVIGSMEFDVIIEAEIKGDKKPKVKSIAEAAARTAEGAHDPNDLEAWLGDDLFPSQSDDDTAIIDAKEIARLREQKTQVAKFELPKTEPTEAEKEQAAKQAAEKEAAAKNKGNSQTAATDAIRKIMRGR